MGKDAELRSHALEVMSLITFAIEDDQTEIARIMSGLMTVANESGTLSGQPLISLQRT